MACKREKKCKCNNIKCPTSVRIVNGSLRIGAIISLQLSFNPCDASCCLPQVAFIKFSSTSSINSVTTAPISPVGIIQVTIPPGTIAGPIFVAVSPCCPILQTILSFPSTCLVDPICSTTFCTVTCNTPSSGRTISVAPSCPATCITASACFTSIQTAIDNANSGDTIIVCPGTYTEQILVPANKDGLVIKSQGAVFIQAPSTLVGEPGIVTIRSSSCVTFQNFTVQGPTTFLNCSLPTVEFYGIVVDSGGTAIISGNTILNIRDSNVANSGCQRGRAITVEAGSSAIITNNIASNYQKTGVRIRGIGACAQVISNTLTGTGFNATFAAANNGIQVQQGASARVSGNTVSNHIYFNPVSALSAGILLFATAGPICAQNNNSFANQIGIALAGDTITGVGVSNAQVTSNTSSNNTTQAGIGPGFGIMVDALSTGNTINLNTALNNATMDVVDESKGTESCCTGNAWLCNTCMSDNLGGCLCQSQTATCTVPIAPTLVSVVFSP